jgi:hypothetical protein
MSHSNTASSSSKPTKILADHVYRGKSGRTRLVLAITWGSVRYVDQKGKKDFTGYAEMLRWAVAESDTHRSELGTCPICHSHHVCYYDSSEIGIRCDSCGFCSPLKAPGERRRLSQKGMKLWWLKIAEAIRKGGL